MFRIYLVIVLITLLRLNAVSQKHDNIWLAGRGPVKDWPFGNVIYQGGGVVMDFSQIPPKATLAGFPNGTYTSALISDAAGNLISYTNGCYVVNKAHKIMENGDAINPGLYQGTTQCFFYYPTYQGTLFLPDPGDKDRYYLFHIALDYGKSNPYFAGQRYYYSIVDASKANGLGAVTAKNQLMLEDSAVGGYIAATKHANGRDWWIISPHRVSNKYFVFLLTPQGAKLDHVQVIGDSLPLPCCGQTTFSPDGSKYFRSTPGNGIKIFDFDRCTGVLNNQVTIDSSQTARHGPVGVVVSHDNHFLYASTGPFMLQYDLKAPDIAASRVQLAEIDWQRNPELGTFSHAQLAPDGKIYMVSLNYMTDMPVIHFPDRAGVACKVEQHGYKLPAIYGNDFIFNFAHYRLGPLDGSPCDTLGLDNMPLANFRWDMEDSLNLLQVTFSDISSYEPNTWKWDFGDGALSTERYLVHTYDKPGQYKVCLTVSNANGSNTLCKTLYLGVSHTENPTLEAAIQVSPNPFDEVLDVSVSTDLHRLVFRLYDALGRTVMQHTLGNGLQSFDTTRLPAGVYFWETRAGGQVVKQGKAVRK